jgi:hypothetical protein
MFRNFRFKREDPVNSLYLSLTPKKIAILWIKENGIEKMVLHYKGSLLNNN